MKSNIKQLASSFLRNKNSEEMNDFLKGILTPKELVELSTRLEIVKMLKKGTPQHVIAEELGVGVATVTRGSKELQKGRFKNV
jgi:TrpR family transcriptional regulator, trp operon repressor